jgi:hypothetical protein
VENGLKRQRDDAFQPDRKYQDKGDNGLFGKHVDQLLRDAPNMSCFRSDAQEGREE